MQPGCGAYSQGVVRADRMCACSQGVVRTVEGVVHTARVLCMQPGCGDADDGASSSIAALGKVLKDVVRPCMYWTVYVYMHACMHPI